MTDNKPAQPMTAAGQALLEKEALNSRSFTLIDIKDILAIERQAVAAYLASDAFTERLARALQSNEEGRPSLYELWSSSEYSFESPIEIAEFLAAAIREDA